MGEDRSLSSFLGIEGEGAQGVPAEGAPAAPAETALQPAPKRPIATLGSIRGGTLRGVDVDPGRLGLKPPRLLIVHKKDRRDQIEEPGQMKLGKFVFDEVLAVFVRAHEGRMLPLGKGKKSHIACASDNGQEPLADIAEAFSERCKPCAYAQWRTLADGSRKPPPCTTFTAFLGVLLEGKKYATRTEPEVTTPGQLRPFWMIGSKTGEGPFLALLGEAQRAAAEEGLEHLGQFAVRVTTEGHSSDAFAWYTPVFTVQHRMEREQYGAIAEQAEELRWAPSVRQEDEDASQLPQREEGDGNGGAKQDNADDDDIPF